ncbi:MAG: hypothetical protein SX243_02415 [Acidobacteriota bacterium]|nr:hypothetical protein [Acidobacteriota bacterium]
MSTSELPEAVAPGPQEHNALPLLAHPAHNALEELDRLTYLRDQLQLLLEQVSERRQEVRRLLESTPEPVQVWSDKHIALSLFKTGLFDRQGLAQISCKLEFHPPLSAETLYWTGFTEEQLLHSKNFELVGTLLEKLVPHLSESRSEDEPALSTSMQAALPALRSIYNAIKETNNLRERYYKGEKLEVLRELDASEKHRLLLNILDLKSEKLFWAREELLKLRSSLKALGDLSPEDEELLNRLVGKLMCSNSE